MRIIVPLVLTGFLAGTAHVALAQGGDPDAGHALASTWCGGCHMIDAGAPPQAGDQPPAFAAVANMSSTTAMSLHAFLQTPHARMPDWQLSRTQIDDVVAYILTLKK